MFLHIILIVVFSYLFFRYFYFNKANTYNYKRNNLSNYFKNSSYKDIKRINPIYESIDLVAPDNTPLPTDINIDSKSFSLFNLNRETTIFGHNINSKIYPASTTKLLTALTAIKYSNLNKKCFVSKNATNIYIHSSKANLEEGDKLTIKKLLYAMMLPSGNDAAIALAEGVAGSEKDFVKLMNKTKDELGAKSSNFENPHGLHHPNHYTTAFDMQLIVKEALSKPILVKVLSKKKYTTTIMDKDNKKKHMTWESTNLFKTGNYKLPKGYMLIGGKTGNTDEAKRCLVLLTKNKNDEIILSEVFGVKSKDDVFKLTKKLLKNAE